MESNVEVKDGKTELVEVKKQEVVEVKSSSPLDSLMIMMGNGINPEQIEKFLDIQERWEKNEARKAYNRAIAEFKKNPPIIEKNKTVQFNGTKYNHASLDNAVEKITADLSKHGLTVSWNVTQGDKIRVTCIISHVLGHYEETTLEAGADTSGSKNSIQALGSTITYLERYTLLAALGLAAKDQDDDGHGATDSMTTEHLKAIRDFLSSIGETNEKPIAEWMKVERIEDIKDKDFPKVLSLLNARKVHKQSKEEVKK